MTFPTPVVLSIKYNESVELRETTINGIFEMWYDDQSKIAETLDGQHRFRKNKEK